jgi:hypothetical protein
VANLIGPLPVALRLPLLTSLESIFEEETMQVRPEQALPREEIRWKCVRSSRCRSHIGPLRRRLMGPRCMIWQTRQLMWARVQLSTPRGELLRR